MHPNGRAETSAFQNSPWLFRGFNKAADGVTGGCVQKDQKKGCNVKPKQKLTGSWQTTISFACLQSTTVSLGSLHTISELFSHVSIIY